MKGLHPLRSTIALAALAAAVVAIPALGASDGSCPPEAAEDGIPGLAAGLRGVSRFLGFGSEFVQRIQQTTFDLHEAHDTSGRGGVVATEPFNDHEMRELNTIEGRLKPCVVGRANIRQAFRAKRGVPAGTLGVVGIAYAYNNGLYNRNPDGSEARGGQIIVTDLFFDKQAFNKHGNGDAQMRVAMGWTSCQPPTELTTEALGDVSKRSKALPKQLRKVTRDRILFHEYIHGVTHEQEENGYTDPNSVEGFFGAGGASRFSELRTRLFQGGGILEGYNQRLQLARGRDEYCSIHQQRADYLRSQGVPQRWPGDTHALDDRDEYVTILIEQMMYDPNGMTGYNEGEKAWAQNWWNYTFNPAYRPGGTYPRLAFGECPSERVISASPESKARPGSFTYGNKAAGTVSGF